ncbi:hypothetical protein K7I13_12035 [Brucepastera parasyntrophica]|uniref:hypothetical protein n=1 Tax=Brucepastera parasyntrophica TaxID=2880008 RepID=UPI00210C7C90|nr:hypothetical protein [Brucepastera parasyntrophica]ULQ59216.1 hypothetical protein K7I13_12035 [Brucepastera parasyntrophica]
MEAGKETIEKIEDLVKQAYTVTVGEKVYSAQNLYPVMNTPTADTLRCHTLRGIVDYLERNPDNLELEKYFINVLDVDRVSLDSVLFGENRVRERIYESRLDPNLEEFPFGRFMSQEEFIIKFLAGFQQQEGDDFAYIVQMASKLTGGTSLEGSDDGISQTVTVKRGSSGALKGEESTKPFVNLAPYRTFREIKQVQGRYLLRIRQDENDIPKIALFEADGGAWRNDATFRIAEYFRINTDEMLVIS